MRAHRAGMATAAALVAFLGAALLWVRPFGDFPLNDDWAYAESVTRWLAGGQLRLSDWVPASSVFHIAWGAGWAALFGNHFAVLRLSVLFWLAIAGIGFAATLRRLGASEGASALAAFCLVANPLSLVFALSFHTDVTFLGLGIAATYFFVRWDLGERDGDAQHVRLLWAASLLATCAFATRQIGLGLSVGFAAAMLWRRTRSWQAWLPVAAVPTLGALAWGAWFDATHPTHWASRAYLVQDTLRYLADPALWIPVTAWRVVGGVAFVCLLSLPVIAAGPLPRGRRAAIAAAGALAAALWLGPVPHFANALGARGVGTLTLHAAEAKSAGFFAWPVTTAAITLATWLAAWWAIGRAPAADPRRSRERGTAIVYVLIWTGVFLMALPKRTFFDRYLLVLLPAALAWTALLGRATHPLRGVALVAGMAVISLVGTADYFAWNEAKWQLGRRALAAGVAPGDVAGGVDWDAHWSYVPNMERLKQSKPLEQIGRWEWQAMNPRRSLLSFAPHTPPWVRIVDEQAYWTPLSPLGEVTLYRLERPEGPRR